VKKSCAVVVSGQWSVVVVVVVVGCGSGSGSMQGTCVPVVM